MNLIPSLAPFVWLGHPRPSQAGSTGLLALAAPVSIRRGSRGSTVDN